jgi:hypothetical protein
MTLDAQEIRFDGIHCRLSIGKPAHRVVLMKIAGTDVGEFGDAPMRALAECVGDTPLVHLFIDARDVRGASIEVSGEWAGWLSANKAILENVTMLTGSRFIHITAEFVRRFSNLEGSMRICTDPVIFEFALREATRAAITGQGLHTPRVKKDYA